MNARRSTYTILAVALVALGLAAPVRAADPRTIRAGFSRLSSGFSSPIAIAAPDDGTGRLFVAEQPGRIRVRSSSGTIRTYLDIRSRVRSGGERGLLGLAFHPNFRSNGQFFVHYTDGNGDVRISRFRATPSANSASANTETILVRIPHRSYANHNGGQVAFSPRDGYLYAAIGDGGGQGDPAANSQDLGVLLGKIIRIDVDGACSGKHYCIPSTNPFARSTVRRREIWHYGLRNPWRFSFAANGTMWIGDVGERAREEIDTAAATTGGRNYGWDCREGSLNTAGTYGGSYCSGKSFVGPFRQYSHSDGRCAIIGGNVYSGSRYRALMNGVYLYGDYCTGEVWGLARTSSGSWVNAEIYDHSRPITSFGQDATGEVYAVDIAGYLYRVTARSR